MQHIFKDVKTAFEPHPEVLSLMMEEINVNDIHLLKSLSVKEAKMIEAMGISPAKLLSQIPAI